MDLWPRNGWFVGLRRILFGKIAVALYIILATIFVGCIAHNLLLRRQAAKILRDIQTLKPGSSPMNDVSAFAAKHHLQKALSCTYSDCDFSLEIYEDRGIGLLISAAQDAHVPTTVVDELRVRRWSFRPWMRVRNGTLIDIEVSLFVEGSFPEQPYIGWGLQRVSTRFATSPPPYAIYPSGLEMRWAKTPGYFPIRLAKEFRVYLTPQANADQIKRAFDYKLECFAGGKPCRRYADIAPEAWADLCRSSPIDCGLPF